MSAPSIGIPVLFLIVSVTIVSSLAVLEGIYSVNMGACEQNETGYWVNCSLSNSQAEQLQNTIDVIEPVYTINTYMLYLLLGAGIVTTILLFRQGSKQ